MHNNLIKRVKSHNTKCDSKKNNLKKKEMHCLHWLSDSGLIATFDVTTQRGNISAFESVQD